MLAKIPISRIASEIGVCESYAADIRAGRHRPHRRHFLTLAHLAGIPSVHDQRTSGANRGSGEAIGMDTRAYADFKARRPVAEV